MPRQMTGSVFYLKSRKKWVAELTLGYREGSGSPKKWRKYARTKGEAERLRAEMLHEYYAGTLVEPSTVTVEEWVEQWLSGKLHSAEKTKQTYKQETRKIVRELGKKRLQELKPLHIQSFFDMLATDGSSDRARRKAAMHLRSMLDWAVQLEVLQRNPARGVKQSFRRTESRAKAMTPDEVRRFKEAATAEGLFPFFHLMLALGLRPGEALGLKWGNVDLVNCTVFIDSNLAAGPDGPVLTVPKTPRAIRTIPIDDETIRVLQAHRALEEGKGRGVSPTDLVIRSRAGTAMYHRNMVRVFRRVIGKADLEEREFRPYDLRHTNISLMLAAGKSVEIVSKRVGHSSVAFTLDHYRHFMPGEEEGAAVSLSSLIGDPALQAA